MNDYGHIDNKTPSLTLLLGKNIQNFISTLLNLYKDDEKLRKCVLISSSDQKRGLAILHLEIN